MKCAHCGKIIPKNTKFCPECGKPVTAPKDDPPIHRIVLKCQKCNGTMTVDSDQKILFCPYCGAKEMILESDNVTIERIKNEREKNRNETIRGISELEYKKHQDDTDFKREQLYYEENKEKRKVASQIKLILVLWGFIFLMLGVLIVHSTVTSKGKISFISSSEDYIGLDAGLVEMEMRDAGFTDIEIRPLNDLKEGEERKDNTVYKIIVDNKDSEFKTYDDYLPDVHIILYCHSIP